MASPQTENGFTMIAHELLEAIIRYPCSGGQKDIILATIRLTYGFHRKERELSIGFLARITGRHKNKVAEDITSLICKRVLLEVTPATFSNGRTIALNKDYEQWVSGKSLRPTVDAERTVNEIEEGSVSEYTDHVKKHIKIEVIQNSDGSRAPDLEITASIQETVRTWNEFAGKHELPKVLKVTKRRKNGIIARLKEKDFNIAEVFQAMEEQPFLFGQSERGWRVDFDWIFLHTDNYVKVMERKYKNGAVTNKRDSIGRSISTTSSQHARATFRHDESDIQRLRDLEATLAERDRARSERARSD
jgi:phage replication O-like protein O